MKQFDVIIIGTGGATLAADAALRAGKRVAIVEKGKFGGTCLNRGCIPTKFMVSAADAVREVSEMHRMGVEVEPAKINWSHMSERVWNIIGTNKGTEAYYENQPLATVYKGYATFIDNHSMRVTMNDGSPTEEITAPIIVLGVGAKTKINDIEGLEEAGYLSSESLFGDKYPEKPYKSLIVMGGGAIGTEFSHVFATAGTDVTLIQHNVRLLPKEDEAISARIKAVMVEHGINVMTNQKPVSVRVENGEKVLTVRDRESGEITEVRGEEILMASGVRPATDELGLENTDIELLPGGWIKTNEFLETSVDGVYALGDVNGEAAFRHRANYEGDILGHNLFVATSPEEFRWARYDLIPAVTFTYPQVAHVGLTEAAAREAGYDVGTGENFYSHSAKGMAWGYKDGAVDDGMVKIVVDKATNKILGAHAIGREAALLVQPFINLMNSGEISLVPIHEEIGSETTKRLREQGLVRFMDPQSVITIGEIMTPHPALGEVIMWTQAYYEKRW